jgi:hypothetical protein
VSGCHYSWVFAKLFKLAALFCVESSPPEPSGTAEGVLAQADMASLPYNPVSEVLVEYIAVLTRMLLPCRVWLT